MGQQAGEVVLAHIRQRVARVLGGAARCRRFAHKRAASGRQVGQRLVQMPAARHDVWKRRAAHEGGVVARPAQRHPDRIAKQHHVVRRSEGVSHIKHRLNLAGAQLHLQRQQRQTQCLGGALDDAQRRLGQIEPGLGQQVVAGVNHAHPRRLARPCSALRIELCAGVLYAVDVKLDFQPAAHAEARRLEAGQRTLQHTPGVELDSTAIEKPGLALQPAT